MDLSPQDLAQFEHAFELLNSDKDGSVTIKDLSTILRKLGRDPTEAELKTMINEVDLDGNGAIEFDEFLHLMSMKMCEEPSEEALRETFRVFDNENTGFIGIDQLRGVMIALGETPGDDELDEMIHEHDLDGDGKICFEEFVNMMTMIL
ncbi:maker110 [Drosophila busckii]|uniref:Maker110 n=1 Tax=Drosophila busckii TaxID=30019 RepID=A0A0M5J7I1_DROBS|nr:calmodulin-beta [Drosophila busckii]ALC42286.1 maker110 [Drosophila busckii]